MSRVGRENTHPPRLDGVHDKRLVGGQRCRAGRTSAGGAGVRSLPHQRARLHRTAQVFIADDPSRDVPRRSYVTPEALLCSACQLPECKPGCPAGAAARGLAMPPAAPAEPIPTSPAPAHADESAFSEGRSSEDSVLLGLPSPTCSVLPPPSGLLRVLAGAASFGCSDVSPPVEPALKQQRLVCWDAVAEPTATVEPHGEHALPAVAAPTADPVPSSEAALAAALRSISKGLGDDDGDEGSPSPLMPPAPALGASMPLPAVTRPPARWEQPRLTAAPMTSGSGSAGGGSSSAALSAALANISKGLLEDGLL